MKVHSALVGHASPAQAYAREPTCPRCDGPIDRIPRLALDRLVSLVVPLRRYRCCTPACAWEGTLRTRRDATSGYGQDGRRPYL